MVLNNYIFDNELRKLVKWGEFQIMYLASIIVDRTFNFFKSERKILSVGKPPFDLKI